VDLIALDNALNFPILKAETISERGQTEQSGDASELNFSQCAVAGQNQRAKDKANSAQNAAPQAGEQQSSAAPSAKRRASKPPKVLWPKESLQVTVRGKAEKLSGP